LTEAMKARDPVAVAALRSALAALDNAEAVDPAQAPAAGPVGGTVAKSLAGLGAGEVPRRTLTEGEEAGVLAAELHDRQAAADDYERLGEPERAARLRAEAEVLAAQLPGA
jgi:uncharacterized protein YqeY